MILASDQPTFDALHPFSFVTDRSGTIIMIGRSLKTIYPSLRLATHFLDSFTIEQPEGQPSVITPVSLQGGLLVLASSVDPLTKLRGQVVSCGDPSGSFIFSLDPSITSLSDVSRLGLTITDFKVGDPIFDFLLYMQGQLVSQTKLRSAKRYLEWEDRVSKLLLEVALQTERSTTEAEVYQTVISLVCKTLEWEVGHLFIAHESRPDLFVSANIWEIKDPERFRELRRSTRNLQLAIGEGLPGLVRSHRHVVWTPNLPNSASFLRQRSIQRFTQLTGVGVPILVDNEVAAVMEFFTERPTESVRNMSRFFELLSLQISTVVARQRAELEARRNVATLAHASKMATLGEIAAGVAHEINNPLHTLTLTSTLLRRLVASDHLSKELLISQLNIVKNSIDRMAMIVSELKAFSRDSSADEFQSTSLKKLLDGTLDLCHARFAGHSVSISIGEIPEGWRVECRASQISQVILNLLNNAFDAVVDKPERWIRVDVFDRNEQFEIVVTDSGAGIPANTAQKIMSPFFTTKPPGKGTGLGLSISSNIMTDHRGSLTLDRSSPNTRFVVTLPKKSLQPKSSTIETQSTRDQDTPPLTEHGHDSEILQRAVTD